MKTFSFYTFQCDCCKDPLILHAENNRTAEMLVLYRSKEIAQMAATDLFPMPMEIMEITVSPAKV